MEQTNNNKVMEKIILIIILLFIVASESTAQYCIKKCKTTQKMYFLLLAIFMYALVCLGLYKAYDYNTMGMANVMWSGLSIVAITMIGIIYFHETITYLDIMGVVLVFIGMFLIYMKE
jgi:small multidrug resistance pump